MSRTTVTRYLRAGEFPARPPTTRSWSKTEAHGDYFRRRWAEGCHSPRQLWLEVQQQGGVYSEAAVWRWASSIWRKSQLIPMSGSGRRPWSRRGPV